MPGPQRPVTLPAKHGGSRYVLDSRRMTWPDAEAACGEYGGHLASFASAAQQALVEEALLRQGALLPPFHR